jgi:hypothetical protein
MAEHKVKITLPKLELENSDTIFEIHGNNKKIGTLIISKGAIEWASKNWKRNKGYKSKLTWREFDELMSGKYKGKV